MNRGSNIWILALTGAFLFLTFGTALYLSRAASSPLLEKFLGKTKYWVVDEKGKILSSTTAEALPKDYNQVALPSFERPLTFHPLSSVSSFTAIRELSVLPRSFLVLNRNVNFVVDILRIQAMYFIPSLLVYGLLLGVTFTCFLRVKRKRIERVLAQVACGNLQARFKIKHSDPNSLLAKFNLVAEKVEQLVNKRKATERSTSDLLQDLSLDIRPRLNQLRRLVQESKREKDLFTVQEKMESAVFGMQLFERLIENLFLIAQIRSPEFRPDAKQVSFVDIINQEVEKCRKDPKYGGKQFILQKTPQRVGMMLLKGEPVLIQQLVQKILENSGHWAKWRVDITLSKHIGKYELSVVNDGPEFSAAALETFGYRRARSEEEVASSLGMGSIIIHSIVEAYGGSLAVRNLANGRAEIKVTLPEPIGVGISFEREAS